MSGTRGSPRRDPRHAVQQDRSSPRAARGRRSHAPRSRPGQRPPERSGRQGAADAHPARRVRRRRRRRSHGRGRQERPVQRRDHRFPRPPALTRLGVTRWPEHARSRVDEPLDRLRQLDRLVALQAVARLLDVLDLARRAAGGAARPRRRRRRPTARRMPRASSSGTCDARRPRPTGSGSSGWPDSRVLAGSSHAEALRSATPSVPSSRCSALCRMPRRSDASVRVGLYSIVRASRSSKLSKLSGPLMNAAMVDDLRLVHPRA